MSKTKTIIITTLFIIMLATGAVTSYYFYYKYEQIKKNPQAEVQKETSDIINKVGKIIQLPTDETPTIATIQDKNKLSDQPFFKNAENGDIVLIFQNAMKAILYRPTENKIIEVAPYNVPSSTATTTTSVTTASSSVTVPTTTSNNKIK